MRYAKWDEVVLKVEDKFGYRDKVYSRLKVMVVGYDTDVDASDAQYLCYVPPYERVPYGFPTFTIDKYHVRALGVDPKFLGDTGCFITARMAIFKHIPAPKGENCDKCRAFFEGVNRENGVYLCRPCRENPYR